MTALKEVFRIGLIILVIGFFLIPLHIKQTRPTMRVINRA